MGKKRKRGQTKQSWGATNSKRQKKRRKTRGHGLNQAKFSMNVDGSKVKLSNTMDCKMLELISCEKLSSSGEITSCSSPSCTFSPNKGWTFRGISTMFSRLHTFASIFQRSTMDCFKSIRNVFLLLNWLKRLFGCGLQNLGKFPLTEKDQLTLTERTTCFEEMMRRMEYLEEEVKLLKSGLAKKPTCACANSCTSTLQGNVQPSLPLKIAPGPPPPLPPPPPPPPPPVLPAAAPPLAFLKKKQPGSKLTEPKENKNKPSRSLVTLDDLKKVKLKKVKELVEMDKENADPESEITARVKLRKSPMNRNDVQCLVSLREIKNVKLKRTKAETEMEKIKLRTPEEMVVMRQNLRKVNINRSPGGTPVVSGKNCEHGTGLTPMMTRALRRKFQHAHPNSSPDSPTGKRKRQSLSPMAGSPNTPSPLLIR